ncbi:hypothetical protein RRG08_021106 [Elysia crispata]|uniref:Uncharacterized protein n=1 Tax=Elysia crispata TaxID=231223 RepID=A0AAE0Z5I5_9GAST|nr:hypothetical protein RRG08_021106 [Elysia crispata]
MMCVSETYLAVFNTRSRAGKEKSRRSPRARSPGRQTPGQPERGAVVQATVRRSTAAVPERFRHVALCHQE